jgi:hypothetical protein
MVRVRVKVRVRIRVRVRVRVRDGVANKGDSTFSVWTEFTVLTGKRQQTPERNAIGHTHVSVSSGGAKA